MTTDAGLDERIERCLHAAANAWAGAFGVAFAHGYKFSGAVTDKDWPQEAWDAIRTELEQMKQEGRKAALERLDKSIVWSTRTTVKEIKRAIEYERRLAEAALADEVTM